MHNVLSRNYDLEVRQIVADTAGVTIDSVYSDTKLEKLFDDDSHAYFWRAMERQFDWMTTPAQQAKFPTVGHIVRELKLRARVEGKIA